MWLPLTPTIDRFTAESSLGFSRALTLLANRCSLNISVAVRLLYFASVVPDVQRERETSKFP
ncbi:hypothetical protein HMPREF0591_2235 [Mycobacterium parascrofulaceum ATCC BAA-614]|uniref:Uncharacterized protein n=1 Tax=Mycobacterium parascrofulaceum ATCC BAA-614 TaxID=525368 RepID=D5P7U1_9MYCO|nr:MULTISPECIES: hypothetical protein [Mycobacterium]EFG77840.1 hypothetical protein HMPREF0591_2235 [Mycobacterium parascrofulaceum ATCC BAA-614]